MEHLFPQGLVRSLWSLYAEVTFTSSSGDCRKSKPSRAVEAGDGSFYAPQIVCDSPRMIRATVVQIVIHPATESGSGAHTGFSGGAGLTGAGGLGRPR